MKPLTAANTTPPENKVRVSAPSRLHFGMFGFGQPDLPQFGGVGVMIQRPRLRLSLRVADDLAAKGPLADRVREFADTWAASRRVSASFGCRIVVETAPRPHCGLGSGTQLAMATAAGLEALFAPGKDRTAAQLAISVNRARRSAVGTYGFRDGGLIIESGRRPCDEIAPIERRIDFPPQWRFVLLTPLACEGLSGQAERRAFAQLPPVPREKTARLRQLASEELAPAAEAAEFDRFSKCLYQYGYEAGMCFAAQQGGAFANDTLSNLVERVRQLGVEGVGQSSWGPTLFALLKSEHSATEFSRGIRDKYGPNELDITITAADNFGAKIDAVGDA
jgi:beta-ribofuranosylaminobenzene 5'-phosphate synthase